MTARAGTIKTRVRDFRRLEVWWESIALGQSIYQLTRDFPREERHGLTSQMRSAVVSIGSNIAEGAGRGSRNELARFLRIAIGSTCELDRLRRRLIRLVDRVDT